MSQDRAAPALQIDCTSTDLNTIIASTPAPAPQEVQKGRRTRRVATKERANKAPNTPSRRSSIYRGVTRHRWTGRYEAHLWDKSCWNQTQMKKGRQVYLGAYDEEEAAARAYDLAALKYWGPGTIINFPVSDYTKELETMRDVSKEEYLASLRRKSSGFSRGVSKYRGVARHHHNGRWEARIGRIFGNKYLYLGTYSTQEEAAAAYDMAAIEYRGLNAVTNFDLSRYIRWLRPGQPHAAGSNVFNPDQTSSLGIIASSVDQKATSLPHLSDSLHRFPPAGTDKDQSLQSTVWDTSTSQACGPDQGYNQLANAAGQAKSSATPTALGLLLQSSMFKQMLERASCPGSGSTNERIMDQIPDIPMDLIDVKHEQCELSFQEEVRKVFDHQEMLIVDQPEDLTFGTASNLDRMFFHSDITFPYLPINPTPQEMTDQGVPLLDSGISPFNTLSLPYPISTCS